MSCFYCEKCQPLDELMIEITQLEASVLYLFKEQTYKGRCNVVAKEHIGDIHSMDSKQRDLFFKDVAKVSQAITKAYNPDKINLGAYADKMQHFHVHVVPKYEGGYSWGCVFEMNPQKVYLTDSEYELMIEKIKENL